MAKIASAWIYGLIVFLISLFFGICSHKAAGLGQLDIDFENLLAHFILNQLYVTLIALATSTIQLLTQNKMASLIVSFVLSSNLIKLLVQLLSS